MAKYNIQGNAGAASATAATAGIVKVEQSATTTIIKILGFVMGPQANSADETYGVELKRQTTAGTWTTQTPPPTDALFKASSAVGATASTAAGTASTILWRGGFHQRAGLQIVPIPGAEWYVVVTNANGVILEYIFCQGTSVNSATLTFEE